MEQPPRGSRRSPVYSPITVTTPCAPTNNVAVVSGAKDEFGFELPEAQDNVTTTLALDFGDNDPADLLYCIDGDSGTIYHAGAKDMDIFMMTIEKR